MATIRSFDALYYDGGGIPFGLKPSDPDLLRLFRAGWTACVGLGYVIDLDKVDDVEWWLNDTDEGESFLNYLKSILDYSGSATAGGTVETSSPTTESIAMTKNGYLENATADFFTAFGQTDPGTATISRTTQSGAQTVKTTAGTGTAAAVEAKERGWELALKVIIEQCRMTCALLAPR